MCMWYGLIKKITVRRGEEGGGDTDIAFKWSKDAGKTFSSKKLSRGLGTSSLSPQLAATEGGNVYMVWVDNNILYFKSSQDHGSKFNNSIILDKNVNLSSSPQLAATEGGNVYVVWVDKKNNSTRGGERRR